MQFIFYIYLTWAIFFQTRTRLAIFHSCADKMFQMNEKLSGNFKQMINCPVTRDNMNQPTLQRTNWRCHCSVTYVIYAIVDKFSWDLLIHLCCN